jgi:hypothetical protein
MIAVLFDGIHPYLRYGYSDGEEGEGELLRTFADNEGRQPVVRSRVAPGGFPNEQSKMDPADRRLVDRRAPGGCRHPGSGRARPYPQRAGSSAPGRHARRP